MPNQAEIRIENGVICIAGDLDFNNVMSIYKESLKLFSAQGANLIVDFNGLHTANSAALAIIIDWMRFAKKTDKNIRFKNLSADIMSLAKASQLDKIIAPCL